ncbi:DUF305 domain-containing protein [Candidatus Aquiluna sp. UB-MaderosW2red]|uniref:DUF305 domain-containing protein n=1 Tax=Candidatus Aquiluna sp. UB-MaderosW2red TaxID=1855377 RepID=UPI000875CBB0|nr:DUF305 domain-containing protein [Candidatus Aquiluna sp. UB-MaderosW2red]SCX15222.1 Uncharacterized conserved protein, DUF305 family [Candidatus Aquiluna sp. UB-MaderosW2red]
MKSLRFLAITGTLLISGSFLTGCAMQMDGMDMSSSQSSENSGFSGMDVMFAQMMIPHHQQAVEMSTLAESRSLNPEVLAIAAKIKAEQDPEIDQMRSWLKAANSSETMAHSMGMDGMLSETEIAKLEGSSGVEFDQLFLAGMIAHHQGAIEMADMVVNSKNSEAAKLGADIIKMQTSEILELQALLSK